MKNLRTKQPKSSTRYFIIAILLLGWILGIVTMGLVASFNAHYALAFQSPVIIQSPILIRQRTSAYPSSTASPSATLAPTPTPLPTISPNLKGEAKPDRIKPQSTNIFSNLKHADIVWKIYTLESSQGVNDGCKAKGLFNGFGYAQSGNHKVWLCFDSLTEVAANVDRWFDEQLAQKTLPQALCYYNEGNIKNDCGYYQKYLALN